MPCVREDLKIILRGFQIDLSPNLAFEYWSYGHHELYLSQSRLSLIKGKSDRNVLPLSVNEHCFAKKELKISLFCDKLVFVKKWWYTGTFSTI